MSGRTISVVLSDVEEAKLEAFVAARRKVIIENQRKTMSPEDFAHLTSNGKYPYAGATGGALTYHITPCSIGTSVQVSYFGGEKFDITDYDMW
jgi:hypothetical protein